MIEVVELSNYGIKNLINSLSERKSKDKDQIIINVKNIINNVKKSGDEALKYYTEKFDNVCLDTLAVTEEEINEAYEKADKEFINILIESRENIYAFHEKQRRNGYLFNKDEGIYMGQRIIPMDSVGVYVPGGKAAYPSSVLMNVIPAKVAGVKDIIMVTPPNKERKINNNILVAAKIAGVNKIFKVGGAQAIAALAYGTETINNVSMIVGPGNSYVTEAKRQVYGDVGIDMIAGPSEVLIITDNEANPIFIAADLMAQAEHDELASSILLTDSINLADRVKEEISNQIKDRLRKDIIEKSLKKYGKIIICRDINECIEVANLIAPEHLEILVKEPMNYLEKIKNAGAVFLGEYSPEALGDYYAGTNHVLPTNGSARFSSQLSVDTFTKRSSYLYYSKDALLKSGEKIVKFAEKEALEAHKNSIKMRLNYEKDK